MKVFIIAKKKLDLILCSMVIVLGVSMLAGTWTDESVYTMAPVSQKVIILDAGHGGWQPCKNTLKYLRTF